MIWNGTLWRALLLGVPIDGVDALPWGRALAAGDHADRLLGIGRAFLLGYDTTLMDGSHRGIERTLALLDPHQVGFAREGVAMGLVVRAFPRRQSGAERLGRFIRAAEGRWALLDHIGAGFACGSLGRSPRYLLPSLDPLLAYYVFDGLGFRDGILRTRRTIERTRDRKGMLPVERRHYEYGVGRAIWFVKGAEVDAIAAQLARFPAQRRGGLWAGVGFAAAYAGGPDERALGRLKIAAGMHVDDLVFGCTMGCYQRVVAGSQVAHTAHASSALGGAQPHELAELALTEMRATSVDSSAPDEAAEDFRRRVTRRVTALRTKGKERFRPSSTGVGVGASTDPWGAYARPT
ncbi:MAG: DUF1702 family protein [Myxococcales bacterium]|nr:DUF1702 family protein [Myxococcales bacterium]MDD9967471.1 DUF1702 family protein [Myxococcales bacterium]